MSNVFATATQTLSDSSEVLDVVAPSVVEAGGIVWNAPTRRTAAQCAMSLNEVLEAFARCGSDHEAIALANRIYEACK